MNVLHACTCFRGFFYYWTYQFYQTSNDWFMHIEKKLNEECSKYVNFFHLVIFFKIIQMSFIYREKGPQASPVI